MSERLAATVYRVATVLFLPLVFVYFWFRGRHEPAYRQRWRERLGYVDGLPQDAIWVHAASVGEVALAVPLVRTLVARQEDRAVVVTTFTPPGAEQVEAKLADVARHCYLPLDTHGATQRFMQRLQPHCGIIIETELWPNLLAAADQADVPMVIANANISARSAENYKKPWLAALMRPALASLAGVGAAASVYAERFEALGAPAERIHVTGNLKYDMAPDPELPEAGRALRNEWQAGQRSIWVAASTHEGEEAIVLDAHRQLRAQGVDALLILAPRHPQRFDRVRDMLQEQDWRFAARSTGDSVDEYTQVVLGDTLGDVPLFYALSDIAFVGGSLVPGIGGHNMLEAAALARSLIVGPHTEEWQHITDALTAAGGMHIARDADVLARSLRTWMDNTSAAINAGEAAYTCYETERGAMGKLIGLLEQKVSL